MAALWYRPWLFPTNKYKKGENDQSDITRDI